MPRKQLIEASFMLPVEDFRLLYRCAYHFDLKVGDLVSLLIRSTAEATNMIQTYRTETQHMEDEVPNG